MAGDIAFTVVKVVIVRQFFAPTDVTQSDDPDESPNLFGYTIRLARVVDQRGNTVPVYHMLAIR
jgi:hypothetical protein